MEITIYDIVDELKEQFEGRAASGEKVLNSLAHAALKLSTQYENPERELLQNLATFFFNKRVQKLAGAK